MVAWYGLQFVVASATFIWIGQTFGLEGRGLAPAFVSMATAWAVTEMVSKVIDWCRSPRRIGVGQKLQRHTVSGGRALRHSSNGPKLIGCVRIGQQPRKPV